MKKKILIGLIAAFSFLMLSFDYENILGIPSKYFDKTNEVTATIYKPYKKKNITASGYKFGSKINDTVKIIAISHDLKKEYPYGTKVLVFGTGQLDGIYTVSDLMSSKWHDKIDILVGKEYKNVKFKKIKIIKINEDFFSQKL